MLQFRVFCAYSWKEYHWNIYIWNDSQKSIRRDCDKRKQNFSCIGIFCACNFWFNCFYNNNQDIQKFMLSVLIFCSWWKYCLHYIMKHSTISLSLLSELWSKIITINVKKSRRPVSSTIWKCQVFMHLKSSLTL